MPLSEEELREGIKTDAGILNESLTLMVETNPRLSDINVGGKLWTFFYVNSLQKASLYYLIYIFRKQQYVMTASGRYLDLHAEERGLSRKLSIKAAGTGYFHRSTPSPRDVLIPAGTQVSTVRGLRGEQIYFITLEDSILSGPEDFSNSRSVADALNLELIDLRNQLSQIDEQLLNPDLTPVEKTSLGKSRNNLSESITEIEQRFNGKKTSSVVKIEAVEAGVNGNLLSNTLVELIDPPSGVQGFYNYPTTGGLSEESDEELRFRIMHGREARSKSTRAAIEFSIMSIPGVRKVKLRDPSKTGRGAIDLMVVPHQIPMSDALKEEIEAVVNDVRSAGIEVLYENIDEVRIDLKVSAKFGVSTNTIDQAAQDLDFKSRMNTYFNSLDVGETAYMEKLGAAINSNEIENLQRATLTEIKVNDETIFNVNQDSSSPYILQIEPDISQIFKLYDVEISYEA